MNNNLNPVSYGPDPVERYKNYLQIMIWQHNRLNKDHLLATRGEIVEAYRQRMITYNQHNQLLAVLGTFLNDVREKELRKQVDQIETMA